MKDPIPLYKSYSRLTAINNPMDFTFIPDYHIPDLPLKRYVAQLPNDTYKDPQLQKILHNTLPLVEKAFGLELLPTYSYLKKYKEGDILLPHRDRPACEYSVSLCIDTNTLYPFLLQYQGKPVVYPFVMQPGQAVLYKGPVMRHWRPRLTKHIVHKWSGYEINVDQPYAYQCLLHYVDKNGFYANQAGDVFIDVKNGVILPGEGGEEKYSSEGGTSGSAMKKMDPYADIDGDWQYHLSYMTDLG